MASAESIRAERVLIPAAGDPFAAVVPDDGVKSSPIALSPEDELIGRMAGFAIAHQGHDWAIVHLSGPDFTLFCSDCRSVFAHSEKERG